MLGPLPTGQGAPGYWPSTGMSHGTSQKSPVGLIEWLEPSTGVSDMGWQQGSVDKSEFSEAVAGEVSKQIAMYAVQSEVFNRFCIQCFADVAALQTQVDVLWKGGPNPRVVGKNPTPLTTASDGTDSRADPSGERGVDNGEVIEEALTMRSDHERVKALEAAVSRLTTCFLQQFTVAEVDGRPRGASSRDEDLLGEERSGENASPIPLRSSGINATQPGKKDVCELSMPNPLFLGIESGDETAAMSALDRATTADLNIRDGAGMTAVHHAALKGMENVCIWILGRPDFTEINARDVSGRTALHRCAESGLANACQVLLDNTSFLKAGAKDSAFGWTALHCAAAGGHTGTCNILLNHPLFTEVNAKNRRGRNALHCSSIAGHAESSWALLEHPRFSEANSKDSCGSTVLHCSSAEGHIHVCRALLEHPRFTSVNTRNSNGCTALHCAASSGQVETCEMLLGHPRFTVAAARNARGRAALDVAVGEARQVLRRTFRRQRQGGSNGWTNAGFDIPEGADVDQSQFGTHNEDLSHDPGLPMRVML